MGLFGIKIMNKDVLLDEAQCNVADEVFKTCWTIAGAHSLYDGIKTVESSYRSNEPVIEYGFMVGSYAKRNIGHWNEFEKLENELSRLSLKEAMKRKNNVIKNIMSRHRDVDTVMITKRGSNTVDVQNKLKASLPYPDNCLEGINFDGFDTQTVLTETQVLQKKDYLEKGELTMLHRHELQLLNGIYDEGVVPVMVYRDDDYADPQVKGLFEERMRRRKFRSIESWYKRTVVPAIKPFKERFPEVYGKISDCIVERLENGEFRISKSSVIEDVKRKITNI